MDTISEDMKQELLTELYQDCQRFVAHIQQSRNADQRFSYTDLEQLVYITEQMRLKLKMLGAPRIYN